MFGPLGLLGMVRPGVEQRLKARLMMWRFYAALKRRSFTSLHVSVVNPGNKKRGLEGPRFVFSTISSVYHTAMG
jgi:hypothetical protein